MSGFTQTNVGGLALKGFGKWPRRGCICCTSCSRPATGPAEDWALKKAVKPCVPFVPSRASMIAGLRASRAASRAEATPTVRVSQSQI